MPTKRFPAIVVLNTSTFKTSAIISSVSLSMSVWTRATWSLQATTFPKADNLSSTLLTLIFSGMELRIFLNSTSVHVEGTSKPFLFPFIYLLIPHVSLPIILAPEIEVWTTGMC